MPSEAPDGSGTCEPCQFVVSVRVFQISAATKPMALISCTPNADAAATAVWERLNPLIEMFDEAGVSCCVLPADTRMRLDTSGPDLFGFLDGLGATGLGRGQE